MLCFLRKGCTALVIAAQYGFVELMVFLSNHGCDLGAVDKIGDSALHWAAYKGESGLLKLILFYTLDKTRSKLVSSLAFCSVGRPGG